jgi:lipoate-protein ligase B
MEKKPLRLMLLNGLTPYEEALFLQKKLVSARASGEAPDTLIMLEHPPVITVGRSGKESDIVVDSAMLAKNGISVHKIERGGQVTYHGPGQAVGYAIVNLLDIKIGVREFVRRLEETLIRAASAMGVEAFRKKGFPGVFCEQGKIGALGVRVTRGVTYHGFSLNVAPDLSHYRFIHPCGMASSDVTSVRAVVGQAQPFEDARRAIVDAFVEVFDRQVVS